MLWDFHKKITKYFPKDFFFYEVHFLGRVLRACVKEPCKPFADARLLTSAGLMVRTSFGREQKLLGTSTERETLATQSLRCAGQAYQQR